MRKDARSWLSLACAVVRILDVSYVISQPKMDEIWSGFLRKTAYDEEKCDTWTDLTRPSMKSFIPRILHIHYLSPLYHLKIKCNNF